MSEQAIVAPLPIFGPVGPRELIPDQPAATQAPIEAEWPKPRLKLVNRKQLLMRTVDVEQLIAEDHPARAIWEFVGRLDLSAF